MVALKCVCVAKYMCGVSFGMYVGLCAWVLVLQKVILLQNEELPSVHVNWCLKVCLSMYYCILCMLTFLQFSDVHFPLFFTVFT